MPEAFSFDSSNNAFRDLNAKQLEILADLCKEIHLKKGDYLMHEGDEAHEMYIILDGTLEIIKYDKENKQDLIIGTLHKGQTVGEMSLIDQGLRSATIRAATPVHLRSLSFTDLEKLAKEDPSFKSIYRYIFQNISHALRKTSDVAADALRKIIEEHKTRVYMGQFLVYIIVVLALIIYSLKPLTYALDHAADSTNVTVPVIVCLSLFVFLMIRSSKLPLEAFGLTLKNWKSSLVEGVLFSIPFLGAETLLKMSLIRFLPAYHEHVLFEPYALIKDPQYQNLSFWLLINILYWLFIPAQELMARGSLQGLLEKFLTSDKRVLLSIIISNLIFSSAHVYMSEWIAVMAFSGGLFLGWLYSRTHNLIGVIVSHGLIGTYTLAVLGT